MEGEPSAPSGPDRVPHPWDPRRSQSDARLLDGLAAGDERALSEILSRYWHPLLRYAQGFLGDLDAAEEVVQEAFVRLWQGRSGWGSPANGVAVSLRGLLYTVVRNLCLHEQARLRVREAWARREEVRMHSVPTPSQLFQEGETLRALRAGIQELPERRREVFLLVCIHGLSYAEAADALGVALSTVANQMSSALRQIREALRPVSDLLP